MYQQTIVVGHLGADPVMRYVPSGAAVTSFSVATTRKWTNADGTPGEKTTWYRVSAWRKLAEVCNQYLSKGRLVMVIGEASASAYMPKDGGSEPRASLELTAQTVKFLGKGNGSGTEASDDTASDEGDIEVPF